MRDQLPERDPPHDGISTLIVGLVLALALMLLGLGLDGVVGAPILRHV